MQLGCLVCALLWLVAERGANPAQVRNILDYFLTIYYVYYILYILLTIYYILDYIDYIYYKYYQECKRD